MQEGLEKKTISSSNNEANKKIENSSKKKDTECPYLTSCVGIFLFQNCNISSVLNIFKLNEVIDLLLNNFYAATSYRRVPKESDE